MTDYSTFLARKALIDVPTGIPDPPLLSPRLKEHQSLLTRWALKRGRAAIFADTGLGKGWMILEFARVVAEYTGQPFLILAPLAVSQQFEREAAKLGTMVKIVASQDDVEPPSDAFSGICVTNYQKLHKFDPSQFGGVALDEASILKHLDGSTRKLLIESFRETPFRLCATATPSPNDHTELGGQAEFLGVMSHSEMLATFFVHDGGATQDWRLKGHARDSFWRWVCSWGAIVKMPSDIGCSDEGYVLPPLVYHEHIIPANADDTRALGLLFANPANTLNEQRAARRGTLSSRVEVSAKIAAEADTPAVVWCDLNVESEALAKAIPNSVEVTGSQDDDEKETNIGKFINQECTTLVSKASICGFGLNMQFAHCVVFCGVSHSFEQFYQAIRREWRFGVDGEVHVHIVSSELEGRVVENLKAKMRKADELSEETRHHVAKYVREAVASCARETISYEPQQEMKLPRWMQKEERA